MADPTSRSHGRGAPKMPVPPNAGGRTPVSFQPNVNRAKTKRWVEAKQYSYDGTDWGDEEDEYQDEEPPPVPQPSYTQQRTGSASDLSSKRLSGLALGADGSQGSPAAEDQKALPFIRPADIYKRMREQQGTPPPAADSGSQNDNLQSSVQPETAPAQASDSQISQGSTVSSQTQAVPSIGLPELKRVSGFGTDFMNSGFQKTNPEPTEPSLQHQQSQGFRSVVHQAFDVPETPSSTTGSVGRSNSDGTSVVSPIMGARGINDDKTPTIPEEPEVASPSAMASPEPVNEGPVFKPGHRRDLSLPSRDNSPARRPVITEHDSPSAGQVEMSSPESPSQASTPKQSLIAETYFKRASMQGPSSTTENDFIAPLNLGNSRPTSTDTRQGSIPIIVPEGADDSPRDVDNDRLSKDIIRSLSRENSPLDGGEQEAQQSQSQAPDDSIPHQYEKYWDDGQTGPNDSQPNPLVSETHPDWTGPHPLAPQDPYSSSQVGGGDAPSEQPKKPKLERKFSWESSSSGNEDKPQIPGSYSSPPPLGASLAVQEPEPLSYDAAPGAEEPDAAQMAAAGIDADSERSVERPVLSIVPPKPESGSPPEQLLNTEVLPEPVGEMGEATVPPATNNLINEASLLGFRDILGIKSADARIRAFDHTRDQFAALDTGLQHWVESTVHDHPEYADLQSQGPSSGADRTSPTQSRFPKLTSFGNLASTLNTNSPTSATHNRRPSAHLGTVRNRPNVELRGKELLHTAGAFSGKAGEAAKGLFAKGRNKFRPSDKVQTQTPTATRRSLQFPFSPGANGSNVNFSFRSSTTLGNLFKSSRNEESVSNTTNESVNSPIGTNPGLRAKSMDLSRLQSNTDNDGSAQKRARLSLDQTQRASKATSGSDYVGALEREMVAALGLSPTDPDPTSWERNVPCSRGAQAQTEEDTAKSTGKNLPGIAGQQLHQKRPEAASIRPVSDEVGPTPPPKDVPPLPPKDKPSTPPKVYPFMPNSRYAAASPSSDSSEAEDKPSLPAKDQPPPLKDQPIPPPKDYMTVPQPMNNARSHPSISSIGTEEQSTNRPPESSELYDSPPSPLQETADPAYGKPAPQAGVSKTSLPSAEEVISDFKPVYPPAPPPAASEVLEYKRQSISGALETAPGVQSPLRNEVRYSPGTRSSMLSFGRQSGTSKGTRPPTPAKDISQAAVVDSPGQNEESTVDKLKKFGKRRRASVGDMLSSLQGGQKRTLGRISGLFGRQNESQLQENGTTEPANTNSHPTEFKVLSRPPQVNGNAPHTSSAATSEQPVPSVHKPLPSDPAVEQPLPSLPADTEYLRQPRQRASMPPISSLNPLASGRFYSHATGSTPNETSDVPWHTRAESQPFPSQQYERASTPPYISEDSTVQAQQQPTSPNRIPSSDPYSTAGHPHRDDEPRIVNVPPREPVELALTKDDSSDEILMSPTTYPGQEWMPTHM
ncbi:hypothetical protein N7474_005886 [Penicillium riverlandense]|uniref:uncharacterized protein n=1 Tax=Penicillium riverlandense TaxID=1903569 RepID=UPI0025488A47|nr:uncharacterized protein N7474_005886 [Penicillium riverlandense]KAJ5820295.1 hypothetical protein N7474_005886 [Penicillium riverlandense]